MKHLIIFAIILLGVVLLTLLSYCNKIEEMNSLQLGNCANSSIYLKQSEGLKQNTLSKFTLNKMHEVFSKIMETNVTASPKLVPFNIPKLNSNKMQLPKLNKI
jgi:hypothetical protein